MKNTRQNKILDLIKAHDVENQKQLQELLIAEGFDTTQATVSRDIKELRLTKTLSHGGTYRYVSDYQPPASAPYNGRADKLRALFADAVISVECGQNIICVKCAGGMAQAICAAFDAIGWEGAVGTLAGEDTIFILCRDNTAAERLRQELLEMFA